VVEGDNMDYGVDGKLLVCDRTGTFLVDNRRGRQSQTVSQSSKSKQQC